MRDVTAPSSLESLLDGFARCFTRPGFDNFVTLVTGWIACQGRHSISRVIQAGCGPARDKHHSTLYRFLSRGKWATDSVGRVLFELLLRFLPEQVTLILDDTLCHRSGPHVFGGAMHFDAVQSTYGRGTTAGKKGFFAFGHNWVVGAVWLPLPWKKGCGMAIPIVARLYRSKKRCPESSYRKRTELASELVRRVRDWLPADRHLHVVGDTEYSCKTLVRGLPPGVSYTGAMVMDAALYSPPQSQRGRGRPALKGTRLSSPKALASNKAVAWERRTLALYGRDVTVLVKTLKCLWYTVAGTKLVHVVITRDPAGRISDRAYFSTHEGLTAEEVLVEFARRWEIEVAFRNTKQTLGLQDPQNGWWRRKTGARRPKKRPGPNPRGCRGQKAVDHTLALSFAAYALVVLWYIGGNGQYEADVARVRNEAPWYTTKRAPSFTDMLVAIRRQMWLSRFSKHPVAKRVRRKLCSLLPRWLLAA